VTVGLFGAIDASGSGLTAERLRLDLIADNVANVDTVVTPGGGPYRRQVPVFAAAGVGVEVVAVAQDPSPLRVQHDPGNPLADAAGNVQLPNVDVVREMVDMLSATRAYQANATALEDARTMVQSALDVARG
jgi:flagellar basal-body rod protein FlgC